MRIWSVSLFLRLLSCFITSYTFFVADEYYQGPEVAHSLIFGYGHLTWEWTIDSPIRSYMSTFPSVVALYLIQPLSNSAAAVFYAPRVVHALLATLGDIFIFKLSKIWFHEEPEAAMFALVLNWFSWASFYCLSRTLVNSTEAVLTVIALYYWYSARDTLALIVAAFSVVVRPTAALPWLFLGALKLHLWKRAVVIGILALGFQLLVDRVGYGRWVFTSYNFLSFNVLSSLSSFYGTHRFLWYFYEGLPTLFFTYAPLLLAGVYRSKHKSPFVIFCLLVPLCFSFNAHKEFRFLLPTLLVGMCYCGAGAALLYKSRVGRVLLVLILLANLPMMVYFGAFHQSGTIAAMSKLSHREEPFLNATFLMPCHSVPAQCLLHNDRVSLHFLECEPPPSPRNVSDVYFQDPLAMKLGVSQADVLFMFEPLFNLLWPELERDWKVEWKTYHASIYSDSRHGRVFMLTPLGEC